MSTKPRDPAAGLVGRWHKTSSGADAAKYPDVLEFAAGTFRGTRGPAQGFVWWDAGIWRIENTGDKGAPQLVLTTASDELVSYSVTWRGDSFDVVDDQGCRFAYRRARP